MGLFECARACGTAILRRSAKRFRSDSEGSRVHAVGDWDPCGSERYVADARADPSLVREDRLSTGSKFGSADGVYGDPSKASASLGMLGVDAIVSQTVAAIKSAVLRH